MSTATTARRGRDYPVPAGVPGTVYLLHFDRPFGHAKHYTGWTDDLTTRMGAHATGRGARLTEVVRAAGIGWSLAWTAAEVDRYYERRLKNTGGATRRCPICRGAVRPADVPHYGPLPPIVALLEA